jgi:hypothetical protein
MIGTPVVDLAKAGDSRFVNDGVDNVLAWDGLIAGAAALYATLTRRAWLAYAAAVITCPILAFSRFAPLVAWWRLRRDATAEPAAHDSAPDSTPGAAPV